MLTTLDRLLLRAYARGYLACAASLLSLYVVIDLFTNLDDFARDGASLPEVLGHIGTYYAYQSVLIFDRLCESFVLMAAMFTVAWAQRSNELLPVLSAGVSTHRFVRPVLIGAGLFMALGVANQELLIPAVAEGLAVRRDDPDGAKRVSVVGAYDRNGAHIEGMAAVRRDSAVEFLYATLPEEASQTLIHLTAGRAEYVPPEEGKLLSGGWDLLGVFPPQVPPADDRILRRVDDGHYFLYTTDADFDAVTREGDWFAYASTAGLYEILRGAESRRLAPVAVKFHMRLTRFFVGMTLVLMGLGLILRDQSRHVFVSTGLSLAMCAAFYAVIFAGKHLGDGDLISPALAAWLPVLVFAPAALALFDGIQT